MGGVTEIFERKMQCRPDVRNMFRKFLNSFGNYLLFLKQVFRKPEKWKLYWKQFIAESDKLIISSVVIVGVISVFIG